MNKDKLVQFFIQDNLFIKKKKTKTTSNIDFLTSRVASTPLRTVLYYSPPNKQFSVTGLITIKNFSLFRLPKIELRFTQFLSP